MSKPEETNLVLSCSKVTKSTEVSPESSLRVESSQSMVFKYLVNMIYRDKLFMDGNVFKSCLQLAKVFLSCETRRCQICQKREMMLLDWFYNPWNVMLDFMLISVCFLDLNHVQTDHITESVEVVMDWMTKIDPNVINLPNPVSTQQLPETTKVRLLTSEHNIVTDEYKIRISLKDNIMFHHVQPPGDWITSGLDINQSICGKEIIYHGEEVFEVERLPKEGLIVYRMTQGSKSKV